MDRLDERLGVNVGNLIGHTAVRHYVMGDECQKPGASDNQIKAMQDVSQSNSTVRSTSIGIAST
ncbi:MAG: hypothetical protein JO320_04485 [Alphaproteobacteria bacterium]|nr:hypothetical protein [Alphaproteobacteria bacterium]